MYCFEIGFQRCHELWCLRAHLVNGRHSIWEFNLLLGASVPVSIPIQNDVNSHFDIAGLSSYPQAVVAAGQGCTAALEARRSPTKRETAAKSLRAETPGKNVWPQDHLGCAERYSSAACR